MHSYFVISEADVDAQACHRAAVANFHSSGEKSIIHFHKHLQTCNEKCYIVPDQDAD